MNERQARSEKKRRERATGRSSTPFAPVAPHMRLYYWEVACPAFQTLDANALTMLVHLRTLYRPGCNGVVFLSVREARRRLGNVGQVKVQDAFKALLERGWIEEAGAAGFDQKTGNGRARSFQLTNLGPGGTEDGAKKTYMRWQPASKPYGTECQKTAALRASTACTQGEYGEQGA
ncbi:hypothetical protein LL965_17480 [Xanthomonas cassavae CFBP 4642]|uniref:Helix-turn-helix domain-containing protein n=1 Tax=Xanthomonas cassavae CFBP 4642 TaxID=1219375 RepID=A0ABS8HHY9_9XANT|nr:hypothetical protein [Xanthomonas cassavae]MCC4621776.1 hypothetical protein [Xanthomonas cassavae CFBP 4642]